MSDKLEQNQAEIYAKHYKRLFDKLSDAMKKRVLAVKDNLRLVDKDVDVFVRSVCEAAETEADKKTLNKDVDSPTKPAVG